MENSPNCQEPSCNYGGNKEQKSNILKFFKTGIVICEANKPKRIITMDCSTKELHAVPKALLRFPNALRGCEVYLSRMPCISCAKLLIQAQVSQVYYWPNLEMQTTEVTVNLIDMQAEQVDNIFRESYITSAVYIPILDVERVKKRISPRTGSTATDKNTAPITSVYDSHLESSKILEILNLAHIKKDKLFHDSYKEDVEKAQESFQTLAGGTDATIMENNFQDAIRSISKQPKYTHALQLCNLLAARNDSPNTGVGTLIYRKEDIIAVGYNGFPKGTANSLFAQKDDCTCDQQAIICAEANAIILRTEDDLSGTELITTCEPCGICENLIKAMKIEKIIWPNRYEKKSEVATKDSTEDKNDPDTEPFVLRSNDKKGMSVCDARVLALQADREKYGRKDTEGTSTSRDKEGMTKEIWSQGDEGHAYGQAISNSLEVSAVHRAASADTVKEDGQKTSPLLVESESDLETESLDKTEETQNGGGPAEKAEEDKLA
ncbi:cytidine and dCMP deaminase domain-containing protein 1-like isoform X2 [Carettochelys insculpta]|uniref:cytidine and dCMP deaminase domain-containing protein 1-like isoform X2 n=1 Tax=Carettochelys insculpta TaxID=44489 RepID=UPI003EBAA966